MRVTLLLSLLFSLPIAACDMLKPFTSDGCSAFPEGTPEQKDLWLSCCTRHDYAYWKGGTQQQRLQADRALKHCVSAVGEPRIAELMLTGVRVGGTPYLPTSFRWGYGWPYFKPYGALSGKELEQVLRHEEQIHLKDLSEREQSRLEQSKQGQ